MNQLINLFKAFSDLNRLRVLAALSQHEELCACQITELLAITPASVSRHMNILISAHLVESRKEGRWVYYRLNRQNKQVNELVNWVMREFENDPAATETKERMAEILQYTPESLCQKQRQTSCSHKK
ncbi:MAG: ArsR family transcriptional regulator [Lentisphaerae bacterium]|nr:MAG: ArsR family transcriptional regulator [Lentisphaerota bacterium]